MVAGVSGVHGPAVPSLVEQGQEAEPENVTTQLQLMGEKTVWDQVMSQRIVTQFLVQVDINIECQQFPMLALPLQNWVCLSGCLYCILNKFKNKYRYHEF